MNIEVRPYQESDYDNMLDVTMELWHLKMSPDTLQDKAFNTNIIRDTNTIAKERNEGILIALADKELAGVIHIDFKGKKTSKTKMKPLFYLIRRYGLFPLLRVLKTQVFFEHKVDDSELHIHGIVVKKKLSLQRDWS